MTRRTALSLLAAAVVALTPLGGAAQPRAGEKREQQQTVSPDGTEILRWLLHANGVAPVPREEAFRRFNTAHLDDVIFIVLGENILHNHFTRPVQFAPRVRDAGGAVLIATDTQLDLGAAFRTQVEVVVTGRGVSGPNAGQFNGTGFPVVAARRPPANPGPEWAVFDGLDGVTTNRPSYLRTWDRVGAFRSRLAGFSDRCWSSHQGDDLTLPQFSFAVGSSGRAGETPYRLLVLADPSVFINSMIVGVPDNLEFARRTVTFLQEGGREKRRHCIFIQNGTVVERFDDLQALLKTQPPPIPLPNIGKLQDKLVDAGNQIIDRLQERDAFNRMFGSTPARQNQALRRFLGVLLVIATVWAAWAVLSRVWRARQPADVPTPPPGGRPPPPKAGGTGGVFDRRQRELARRNNLYEPVRAAVREMFLAAGAPPDPGPKLPKVVIADVVRRPDTLRDALRDLWKIAFGRPAVVTVNHWNVLEPLFERVRTAHADGKWRFVVTHPEAIAVRGNEA